MENFALSGLDIAIMAIYLIGIVIYGIRKGKQNSSEEYFLGGRSLTWPVVGISLFAANISSSTLIGLAGAAYLLDMTVYNYEWYAVVVLVFFAIFFLPFYLKSGVYTMPEFLERRYDERSRYYFSFITVVGNVLIDTAASLYVGLIVLGLIFPQLPPWTIIVFLAAAAAAYTIPGGLSSVVKTEVIQAIVLIFGSCILTYFAFAKVGGWDAMITQLNELNASGVTDKSAQGALSIVRDNSGDWWRQYDEPIVPWWGLLTGVPLLGFYFWANNQFMVQRVLSSKNLNHGRWGALFAGLLKLPVILIMVIPGTLAFLLYRNSTNISYQTSDGLCENLADCIDYTYPTLLFDLLPAGLLGLVVAGLLAAMMSSISATFNSASTLITMDFINKFKPDMTSKQLVRSGQISTLVLVVLASLWAPQIGKYGQLFTYLQDILGYIAPPIASAFILGLFWKRANATGSFVSLIFGLFLSCVWVGGIVGGMDKWFIATPLIIKIIGLFVAFYYMVLKRKSKGLGFYITSAVSLIILGLGIGAALGGESNHWFFQLHFLLRTTVLFVLCVIVLITVSLATAPPPAEKVKDLTWSPALIKEETEELAGLPWYQNYRILSVILLILTTIVVGFFW